MSGGLIDFESSWSKAKNREALKIAREECLEKAKTKAEWNRKRKDKEDNWMLPDLDKKVNT